MCIVQRNSFNVMTVLISYDASYVEKLSQDGNELSAPNYRSNLESVKNPTGSANISRIFDIQRDHQQP